MSLFETYFDQGKDHILDYANGYDHILFVIALCAIYSFRDWKRVLVLVTAFTIGHSITLALATLNIIDVNEKLVEFLIPVTIFVTAMFNIFKKEDAYTERLVQLNYVFALFFGLIHGMGFSGYLRVILGKQRDIISPLFAFNIGLEFGQIIIVAFFLFTCFIFVDLLRVDQRDWRLVLSSMVAGAALVLMNNNVFW